MTTTFDPVPHWSRRLAQLRAQPLPRRRGVSEPPNGDPAETALEMCDAVLRDLAGAQLECERLRAAVRAETAKWTRLFEVIPGACILTNGAGLILDANRAAGLLLNLSAKHLIDRQLLVFSEDRQTFTALLQQCADSGSDRLRATIMMRPRERRPTPVDVRVVPLATEPTEPTLLLWFLTGSGHGPDP